MPIIIVVKNKYIYILYNVEMMLSLTNQILIIYCITDHYHIIQYIIIHLFYHNHVGVFHLQYYQCEYLRIT